MFERTREKKLAPTDIGEVVNDFLTEHFPDIVDLGFTSHIEGDFDEIAQGKNSWKAMLKAFYPPFTKRVEDKKSVDKIGRKLGVDPKTGREVSVRFGKYGPYIQIGTAEDEEKPLFASVPPNQSILNIALDDALKCFALPRKLGQNDAGDEVQVNVGRYGPYVRMGGDFFSIPKGERPVCNDAFSRAGNCGTGKRSQSAQRDSRFWRFSGARWAVWAVYPQRWQKLQNSQGLGCGVIGSRNARKIHATRRGRQTVATRHPRF